MLTIENIPLFRTKTLVAGGVGAIEPAQRPPLPRTMWITGLATFAEARRAQRRLSVDYITRCGRGGDAFYVAGPDNGLCVGVPYCEVR